MPEQPSTQILETKVRPSGPHASRVDIAIADAATLEGAGTSIVISLEVDNGTRATPFLIDLQYFALHQVVTLLREHVDRLEQQLEEIRRGSI
jgi:hypothetical protein